MSVTLIGSNSAHFGSVKTVLFDPLKEKIISIGAEEGRLYVWNSDDLSVSTGSSLEDKTGNNIVKTAFWMSNTSFFYGGDDKKLTNTNWPECQEYKTLVECNDDILYASAKWDSKIIAYSEGTNIMFFNVDKNESVTFPQVKVNESKITWLQFSANAKYLAASFEDSTVVIWNEQFSEIYRSNKHNMGALHPTWGPGDVLIIPISSSIGMFIFMKASSLEEISIKCEEQKSNTVNVSLSSDMILAISEENNQIILTKVNDDYSLSHLSNVTYEGGIITTLDWGYNFLAAGDNEGSVFLWQVNRKEIKTKPKENNFVEQEIQNNDTEKIDDEKKQTNKDNFGFGSLQKDTGKNVIKPRSTPKKSKSKAKQQTIKFDIVKESKPKKRPNKNLESSKKIELDNEEEDSEYDDNLVSIDQVMKKENNRASSVPATNQSFLDDDDDIELPDVVTQPKDKESTKSFLDDSDFDEEIPEEAIQKTGKPKQTSFLDDEDESYSNDDEAEIKAIIKNNNPSFHDDEDDNSDNNSTKNSSINNENPNVPGYDDLIIPDDDIEDNNDDITDINDNKTEKNNNINNIYTNFVASSRFVPGSYNQPNDKAHILCWNGEGSIVGYTNDLNNDEYDYIEIRPYGDSEFSVKKITEANNIILGTIDENGYMLAQSHSVLYHKNKTYGPEANIEINFPFVEEVRMIAIGEIFFAVATATNFLHIFTNSGLEISVIALNGRIISMSGYKNLLFVVSGNHKFELFDVFSHKSVVKGFLPIYSPLRWIGFNKYNNSIIVEGGNYIVYSLSYTEGIKWTPIVDLKSYFKNGITHFFIVEVYKTQVSGVFLENESSPIQTNPIPEQINNIDFDPPTIDSQFKQFIVSLINYENAENKEKEAKRFDQKLLQEFDEALNQNKLLLSYQIAQQLKTSIGIDLAIRISDQRGQTTVSERLTQLKEQINNESEESSTDFELSSDDQS